MRKPTLRATAQNYLPAVGCALTPILCFLAIRPFAEIGIVDDWSYIKTVQVLAQTGHIVYNGWATAILGWQLYFGALFVKVFGFSFTAVRYSTVAETMATAFLLQRTFVRAGLNSWNATLATFALILSPVCFPLEFTFMTDISGLLIIVVCLYMCLRALAAESERSAIIWIVSAGLLNALAGTARQIAWLGVLVMVPSTLWLLRRNRRVLVAGCVSCVAGACIVVSAMHWFAGQPYSIPEPSVRDAINLTSLGKAAIVGLHITGQSAVLALPMLLVFAGALRSWNRRMAAVYLTGLCCFAFPVIAAILAGKLSPRFVLFYNDHWIISRFQNLKAISAWGIHLGAGYNILRLLILLATLLGGLSLIACLFAGAHYRPTHQRAATAITWQRLGVILGPFTITYLGFLGPRALRGWFDDRYLVPLLAILLLVLARFYQEHVRENLPAACVLLIAIFGAFSLAATHDMFAHYRGYISAIGQLRSIGTPDTAILGPWEFEGWTEVEKAGYIDDIRLRVPKGAWTPPPVRSLPASCQGLNVLFLRGTPAIKPVYAIVDDPTGCGGQPALPPVTSGTWIAPQSDSIYTVRLSVASGD